MNAHDKVPVALVRDEPTSKGTNSTRPTKSITRQRSVASDWLIGISLGLSFCILYYLLGTSLAATGALEHKTDLMFTGDLKRGVEDLTDFGANHWRTRPHPLFVLIFNPPGVLLSKVLGSHLNAAVLMSSAAGGACVILCFLILRQIQLHQLTSILLASILGSSAAHIFYGSVPETYIFAAASLLLLYFALVCRANAKWYVAASLLAMGVLISNLAQACLIYFCGAGQGERVARRSVRVAKLAVIVLVFAAALNVVQRSIYHGSGLFFHPNAVLHERKFVYYPKDANEAVGRIGSLSLHMFVYSFVAPYPTITISKTDGWPSVTLEADNVRNWRPAGALAASLIAILLIAAVWLMLRHRLLSDPLVLAVLLCLGFNLALHSIYGNQLFLYSCNWTGALVLLVGRCWRPLLESKRGSIAFHGLAAILLVAMLSNNVAFFQSVVKIYAER